MLFGKYLMLTFDKKWKPTSNFKRSWDGQLWQEIFDSLLNIPHLPVFQRDDSLLNSIKLKLEGKLENLKENELQRLLFEQERIIESERKVKIK